MMKDLGHVCVYAGAASGARPEYPQGAFDLGVAIARRGGVLVYGGGKVGLMGRVADGAISAGGKAIGIITHELQLREIGHDHLTELRVVQSMHERKMALAELAQAFVALPGGIGTYDELLEILCWSQLGIHEKPIGLLSVAGFFDPLIAMLRHAAAEGFVRIELDEALVVDDDPDRLIDRLTRWKGITTRRWPERA
jgi:uncharacterized protein (TIGR00730 family)